MEDTISADRESITTDTAPESRSSTFDADELTRELETRTSDDGASGAGYDKLLQSLRVPLALIDETLVFTFINQAFEYVAEAPEELIGTPVPSFFADHSQSLQAQSLIEKALSSRKSFVRKGVWNFDGKPVRARMHVRPVRIGPNTRVLLAIEDLAAEAETERAGSESKPAWTAIADFALRAPLPVKGPVEKCFSAVLNALLVSFNSTWSEMPGATDRQTERGQAAAAVFPFRRYKELIAERWIARNFEPFSFETRHEEETNDVRHIENTLVGKVADGFLEGFWLMRRDVSDLKVAETALGKAYDRLKIHVTEQSSDLRTLSEQLLEALTQQKLVEDAIREQNDYIGHIIDSLTDPLFAVDAKDYSIRIANTAAIAVAPEGNPTCWGIIRGRAERCEGDDAVCTVQRVKQSSKPARTEVTRRSESGEVAHLEVLGYPIFDQDRKLAQVIVCVRDITAQKIAEAELKEGKRRLEKTLEGTVSALAAITERKDPTTSGHQQRVADLSAALAEKMGYDEDTTQGIRIAAGLHDIGNVSVPAELLLKGGQLNEHELGIVHQHPRHAYEILQQIEFPWPVAEMVLQHHERLDGSGYPEGLGAHGIMPEACILAVADVVEAMLSARPYRPPCSRDDVIGELFAQRGILYDEEVVDACIDLLNDGFEFPGAPVSHT